jgi:hypothetical protein
MSIKVRFKIRLFVRDSCLCVQAQGRHAPWHDISGGPFGGMGLREQDFETLQAKRVV